MRNRTSPRLQGYDYSLAGGYFVTIYTKDRVHYFGEIIDGKMKLSNIGEICEKCWNEIPNHFDNVRTDTFIVMPDHIHGIIIIDDTVGTQYLASNPQMGNKKRTYNNTSLHPEIKIQSQSGSLGSIIRGFKIGVTKYCRNNDIPFQRQGRYRDRIIRNENEYTKISQYIIDNPLKRELEKEENGIFM